MDDTNYDPKIVLNLKVTTAGLLNVSYGSCTNQKGHLDWDRTYTNDEKMKGFREVSALKKEWEARGTKYEINYMGLTEEEVGVVEGAK